MVETSTFPSVTPEGVQSVPIKSLNACDWSGYIWLHSSESIHHKWRRSWKSNEEVLSGIIVSPCLGWHELSDSTETQDDWGRPVTAENKFTAASAEVLVGIH